MKIAIHHRKGSFSERWIEYCIKNNIDYKIVNAFDNNIIQQVEDCDVFMWHHHHAQFKDVLTAKRILFAMEQAGVNVFPSFRTGWHFDDKIAQKYLLEAINAPTVPSYVFYDKEQAINWALKTTYPKVFKLKGGAGASNVKLVKTKAQAIKLINQAFNKGFSQFNSIDSLKDQFVKKKVGISSSASMVKGLAKIFIKPDFAKSQPNEKGYIYFQEFIPNNKSDIRVIVIKNKAFAVKRLVRPNDFRASGSGLIEYDPSTIDIHAIEIAFEVNRKLKAQCIAFDFVFDKNHQPLIIELSYGFATGPYDLCPGYWKEDLSWHEGSFNPQAWMLENLL